MFIDNGQYRLAVAMQKTKEPIYLPLSNEALKWMPERGDKTADDHVFDLPSGINQLIKPWAKAAGISKRFTFSYRPPHVRHNDADIGGPICTLYLKFARSYICKDDPSVCQNRQ